jgi:hypothetical protein
MGPVIGCLLPVIALVVARWRRWRGWYVFQFIAGFALIANGAYITLGSLSGIGDAGDLLRYHSPIWLLWLFGLITIPIGLWLWNDWGPHFGPGAKANSVDAGVAHFMFAVVLAIVLLEITLSSSVATP